MINLKFKFFFIYFVFCFIFAFNNVYSNEIKFKNLFDQFTRETLNKSISTHRQSVELLSKKQDIRDCIINNNITKLEKIFKSGVDINTKYLFDSYYYYYTPLMIAVEVVCQSETKNIEIIKSLISLGADVNAKDFTGETALMIAVESENIEVSRLLVKSGADVNAKNLLGETALMIAAENDDIEFLDLLLKSGADVNAKDINGRNVLFFVNDYPDNFDFLLNASADPYIKDIEGYDIADCAIEKGLIRDKDEINSIISNLNGNIDKNETIGKEEL